MWYCRIFTNFGEAMLFYKKERESGYEVEFSRFGGHGYHEYKVYTWIDE